MGRLLQTASPVTVSKALHFYHEFDQQTNVRVRSLPLVLVLLIALQTRNERTHPESVSIPSQRETFSVSTFHSPFGMC